MLKTHKQYLSHRQVAKIEEVYSQELFEYKSKVPNDREYAAKGLISRDEFDVTKQEIGFEDLDKEFVYMG